MASQIQAELIKNNDAYASKYDKVGMPLPPAKKFVIVTCMDARLDPATAYGLSLGDATILRNAGGSAKDALRSLIITEHILGVQEVLVIKHTRCGLHGVTNEIAKDLIGQNVDDYARKDLKGWDFLPIGDLEEAVRDDVEFLRAQKLLKKEVTVSGWLFDTDTGRVRKIVD